jgi:hypothetical protein
MKICNNCQKNKELKYFRLCYYKSGSSYLKSFCKKCESNKSIAYNNKHKKEKSFYLKKWNEINCEYKKRWKLKNKFKINQQYKEKITSDPCFKLRKRISCAIYKILNKKNTKISIINVLPYTMEELKTHLQSLFEPWMTWDNWGRYNSKTWNDLDKNTWTWQIDHIVPQSILSYKNEKDYNFIKCWSLSNLRPLSSKQNILDGCFRNRHKEVK